MLHVKHAPISTEDDRPLDASHLHAADESSTRYDGWRIVAVCFGAVGAAFNRKAWETQAQAALRLAAIPQAVVRLIAKPNVFQTDDGEK